MCWGREGRGGSLLRPPYHSLLNIRPFMRLTSGVCCGHDTLHAPLPRPHPHTTPATPSPTHHPCHALTHTSSILHVFPHPRPHPPEWAWFPCTITRPMSIIIDVEVSFSGAIPPLASACRVKQRILLQTNPAMTRAALLSRASVRLGSNKSGLGDCLFCCSASDGFEQDLTQCVLVSHVPATRENTSHASRRAGAGVGSLWSETTMIRFGRLN